MITAVDLLRWFEANMWPVTERVYTVGVGPNVYIEGTFNLEDLAEMINRRSARAA